MVKVFHFGSCRTVLAPKFNTDEYYFDKNYDLTHSTREIFTYLDLYDGIQTMDDILFPECLMYNPEKFSIPGYAKRLKESDVVMIEIATVKLVEYKGVHYQQNRVNQNPNDFVKNYRQTREELIDDLELLKYRIRKPIIFFGHTDLNFYDVPNIYGHVAERQRMDEIIRNNTEHHIIIGDLFAGKDYKEVCETNLEKTDTHHITDKSKEVIYNAVVQKIKSIL
jgi:hypothetical protein